MAARSAAPNGRPSAALDGGPPVAGQDPGRPFPGRARLVGEAGPEARRGHRSPGARALVVELGEVGRPKVASSSGRPSSQAARRRSAAASSG